MKTKLIKKAAAALLALAMLLSMSACGHEHTWADATCTTPKTCTECGKTEGEVLAHDWQDATCAAPKTCSLCKETEGEALPHTWEEATCSAPKTCSVCGETEGEPLPHTLTEANYQSPAVCTVCGAEVGEKLEADCEKYPVPFMEQGVTYDCIFTGQTDSEVDINSHITLAETKLFNSDEEHPAVEGYEYRTAIIDIEVYGKELWDYGFNLGYLLWNYYDDDSDEADENGKVDRSGDFAEKGECSPTYNFNGIDWEDCWIHTDWSETEWDFDAKTGDMTLTYTMRVPVGYDGVIIGVHDPRADVGTTLHLSDVYEDGHFILYRMA